METAMHWAAQLIGLPYSREPVPPQSFNCWALVRWVFEHRHGIIMPAVAVDDDSADNVAAIKRAAEVSGWRPSGARTPAEHDIVLMNGLEGRHVGVMVRADGRLLLLHCIEGPGVCAQPLADLPRMGFSGFVFWRMTT